MTYLEYKIRAVPKGFTKLFFLNWPIILLLCAAGTIGIIMLTSVAGNSWHPWASAQLKRFFVGFVLMISIAMTPIWFWKSMSVLAYITSLGLLLLVEFFGSTGMGAQRWLDLGFINLQPSEMAKITLVMVLAFYHDWLPDERTSKPLWIIAPLAMIFLPFFLLFAFFSKQTPSGYTIILLGLLTIVFFLHHFNLRSLLSLLTSSLLSLVFVFGLLLINDISLIEIYNQFISYPSFVGEIRMKADGFLTPIEFSRYVLKFKFVHLSYIFLLFYLIKFVLFKENLFLKKDFYILVSLIAFSIVLIFHQLLSLNQKFIDLMVPILLGFSHIYLEKSKDFFKKKFIYIKNFLLLFSLIFLIDIFFNYIDNRRFMDLKNVNLENTVDAINIDKSLKGLRWVTYMYPNNPNKEIDLINETISELKKENKNFFLLTHYSFIHSLVGAKSFNSSRVHDDVSIPLKNDKNFEDYKKKFRGLFAEKKINKIFIISPVNYKSIDGIFPQNCLREKKN